MPPDRTTLPPSRPPQRIQRSRAKGWRMPPNTVYVGRPSKWGNPFTDAERFAKAIAEFPVDKTWLTMWRLYGGRVDMLIALAGNVRPVIDELRGKNLACWCPLVDGEGNPVPCHADVLLKLANRDA